MSTFGRRLAKAPSYLRRFGPVHGLQLLNRIERALPQVPGPIRRYTVPGLEYPVYLRLCIGDHAIFWQCLVACQYDLARFPQAARLKDAYHGALRRGERPLIIDCGANIGLAALALAKQFPEASICAVEPDSANFDTLLRNVEPLKGQIRALQGGVWSESGHLRIRNPDAGPAAFQVEWCDPRKDAQAIRAYTIDEICTMMGVDAPFVVKIDIEGAQRNLFAAHTAWVGRVHLIALELDDWLLPWQGTSRPFFACLSKHPFDYLIRGETIFCFRDFEAPVTSCRLSSQDSPAESG